MAKSTGEANTYANTQKLPEGCFSKIQTNKCSGERTRPKGSSPNFVSNIK